MGGTEEGAPYFSRDEELTCLYFLLQLGEVNNTRVLSSAHLQRSLPFPARKPGTGPGQGRRLSLAKGPLSCPGCESGTMVQVCGVVVCGVGGGH